LIQTALVPDFYQLWPERFYTKTNGITPRRWLLQANPGLADLIRARVGDGWLTDLAQLRGLEPWAADAGFQAEFRRIKRSNKEKLVRTMRDSVHVTADPDTLFDIQVKRMHAYKRQLLNMMHIVHAYLALIEDGQPPPVPRTYVFAGKAAPGYWEAKQIIKLIHNVGRVINNDARASAWMKVAFLPDYRVSLAEKIIPAADLSEQISTAGTEASGTSNMKFALNGALTMGTLDGANIEILEAVGAENIFIFGLTVGEVQALRAQGTYRPRDYYERDPRIKRVAEALRSSVFCPHEPDLFAWIYRAILNEHDAHVHLADLPAYLEAQDRAGAVFNDQAGWARKAILNVARIGTFSSDRTVAEYARDIWDLPRVVTNGAS
jgi:starch phosphorylase